MMYKFFILLLLLKIFSCGEKQVSSLDKVNQFYLLNKDKDFSDFYGMKIVKLRRVDSNYIYGLKAYGKGNGIDDQELNYSDIPSYQNEILNSNDSNFKDKVRNFLLLRNIIDSNISQTNFLLYGKKIVDQFHPLKIYGLDSNPKKGNFIKFELAENIYVFKFSNGNGSLANVKEQYKEIEKIDDLWYYNIETGKE